MPWNTSVIAGPISVPIIETIIDPELGEDVESVTGLVSGYHLNLPSTAMTPDLEPFAVEPSSPVAVLLGVETAFLRFADED